VQLPGNGKEIDFTVIFVHIHECFLKRESKEDPEAEEESEKDCSLPASADEGGIRGA
jgi:hypothetical protein